MHLWIILRNVGLLPWFWYPIPSCLHQLQGRVHLRIALSVYRRSYINLFIFQLRLFAGVYLRLHLGVYCLAFLRVMGLGDVNWRSRRRSGIPRPLPVAHRRRSRDRVKSATCDAYLYKLSTCYLPVETTSVSIMPTIILYGSDWENIPDYHLFTLSCG